MDPTKLTSKSEFRMWYDEFSTYISQYTFTPAFNLDRPISIPENERSVRLRARACLLQWLDEEYKRKIYGEMCPTKCLIRINEQREPNLGFQLGPVGEIYSLKFNPAKDNLLNWIEKLETLHRKILLVNKSWNDERLREVFIIQMTRAFLTFNLNVNQAGVNISFSGLKGNSFPT